MKPKEKAAAILTIFDASAMTPKGRADVVKWLTKQAVLLDQFSDQLSKRYTARYLYKA